MKDLYAQLQKTDIKYHFINFLSIWYKIGFEIMKLESANAITLSHDIFQAVLGIREDKNKYYINYLKCVKLLLKKYVETNKFDEYVFSYNKHKRIEGILYLRVKKDNFGNWNIFFKNRKKYLKLSSTYKKLNDDCYKLYDDIYTRYDEYWK